MIKRYLDEDVPEAVAMSLRLRGYDVLTVERNRFAVAFHGVEIRLFVL